MLHPRTTRHPGAVLAAALLLLACDDDAPSPATQQLRVQVSPAGGVGLFADERPLLALADGVAPVARRFTRQSTGQFGLWQFERSDERSFPLSFAGSSQEQDTTRVRYAHAEAGLEATLTVSPHERPGTSVLRFSVTGAEAVDSVALPLACDAGASFYGFGMQYHDTDQRGQRFPLFVSEQGIGRDPSEALLPINGDHYTTYFPTPYFVDARGFGALWTTSQRVLVDLCKTDPDVAWVEVESGEPVEVLVFHGPTPLDVIEQLSQEVGRPPAPPPWAYKLWVSAQGGQEAVLAAADALEEAEVPLGAIWSQDWTGRRKNFSGGWGVQYRWVPEPMEYPDLAGMIAELHRRDVRFLGYANPFVVETLDHYAEMARDGLLVRNAAGDPYLGFSPGGQAGHPDLTNPDARAYVKRFLRAMVKDYGMDGWMADFAEWLPLDAQLADGSDPMAAHNRYPGQWQSLSNEVMQEERPDGDWAVFSRSGWTYAQGQSQIHWIGDQEATFSEHDGLPTVVPALLNMGLSGVPYVTHDVGGFSGGPRTKEVWLRWVELGAFTPIFRTHEGDRRDEHWQWDSDEETIAHFRRFARIHEALLPDIQRLAEQAASRSTPMIRHLMLVFPEDADSRAVSDQFMLGDELLVAPVVREGETEREVYLPPGTWFHVWTGDELSGGRRVRVQAPVGSPPVFSLDRDRPALRAID